MRRKAFTRRPPWTAGLWLAALLILLEGGCSRTPQTVPVVLISIDTCRADHLGCYGESRPLTPNLDAFAQDAVRFTRAISPVPITLPSHCSIMTGRYPPRHGVRDNMAYRLPESETALAEVLREQGYTTGAIVSAFVLDSRFGIAQGFQTFDDQLGASSNQSVTELNERSGGDVSRRARCWLDAHATEDFFLFLHYFDPHTPYAPPEPFAGRHADDPYAGEIAYADACIGEVIDHLKRLDLYERSLIIVAGDHGESRGEHGESTHDYFVYQSTVRVPLLVKPPQSTAIWDARREIPEPVSLVDIAPTVLTQIGHPVAREIDGRDLLGAPPDGGAPDAARAIYCESLTPTKYAAAPLQALVAGAWKYIAGPESELYNLDDDPGEQQSLQEARARIGADLHAHLEGLLAESGPLQAAANVAVDEATRARLQSLGYVTRRRVTENAAPALDLPDAKRFIEFHERFQQALGLITAGDFAGARESCRGMLVTHPEIPDVWILLGDVEVAAGLPADAIPHYRRFVADAAAGGALADAARVRAHYNLANTLAATSQSGEAIEQYREALRIDPLHVNARYNLAVTLGEGGAVGETIAELVRVLEIDPEFPEAHYDLAYAFSLQGNPGAAREHYREALRLRPDYVDAHLRLGDLLAAGGLPSEALPHCETARELRPDNPEAHLKTARVRLELRDAAGAVEAYDRALTRFPDWGAPALELAWILATDADPGVRNGPRALELAQFAFRRTPQPDPRSLETLAAAYAAVGEFHQAIAIAERALAIIQHDGRSADLAGALRDHLAAYRQQVPLTIAS